MIQSPLRKLASDAWDTDPQSGPDLAKLAGDAWDAPDESPSLATRTYDVVAGLANSIPNTAQALLKAQGIVNRTAGRMLPGQLGAPLQAQGAAMEGAASAIPTLPHAPGRENSIEAQVGGGLGFVGQAVLAPEAMALKGAAALVPGAVMGATSQGASNYERVKGTTGDEDKAVLAFLEGAGIGAVGAVLPVHRVLARINSASGGALVRAAKDAAIFGGTGAAQSAANDAVIEHATGEDIPILENALKAGGVGVLTGAIVSGVTHAVALHAWDSAPSDLASKAPADPLADLTGEAPLEMPAGPQGDAVAGRAGAAEVRAAGTPEPAVREEASVAPAPLPVDAGPSPDHPAPSQTVQTPSEPSKATVPLALKAHEPEPLESNQDAPEVPLGLREKPQVPLTPKAAEETPAVPLELTSIKNASVDAMREELGMAPATHGERIKFEESLKRANDRLREDENAGARLVRDLTEKPRALDAEEDALLTVEMTHLSHERVAAEEALVKAQETGEGIEDAQARVKKATEDYFQVGEVATIAGTKTAQGLAHRRLLLKADFSLAAMERAARVAQSGKALSTEQAAEIKALHEKHNATLKEFEAYQAQTKEKEAHHQRLVETLERARAESEKHRIEAEQLAELRREVRKRQQKEVTAKKPGAVIEFLEGQAEQARKRIKERGFRTFAGPHPEHFVALYDHAVIGATHIAKGLSRFADWSVEMLKEFGPGIEPHLEGIFDESTLIHAGAKGESRRLATSKAATRRSIADTEQRIAKSDFKPRKKTPVPLDEEGIRLKALNEAVHRDFERAKKRYAHEHATTTQKAIAEAKAVLDFPKALMTAFDFSAVLRQGAFFSLAHPLKTMDHLQGMFAGGFSEARALQIDVGLRNRAGAEFAKASKLELTSLDQELGPHEEAIFSRLAEKVPLLRRAIRSSNRAFVTFLNLQRAAAFDDLLRAMPGEPTIESGRALANFVNVATGRGNPGKFAGALSALSHVLWSPRLLLSRFQLLAGQPFYRGDAATRKAVAGQYARSLIGLAAVYALAKLAGADIEDDPRSTDFGKLRFGDTRLDPLSGLSQITVLLAREATGEMKTSKGAIVPIRGEGKNAITPSGMALFGRFARSKFTPLLGQASNVIDGEDFEGQPVTPGSLAKGLLVPLSFQDVLETMEAQGVAQGAAMSILGIFGMGMQTYGTREKKPKHKVPLTPQRPTIAGSVR